MMTAEPTGLLSMPVLVVSLVALYAVTRVASRALGRAMARHDTPPPPGP